MKTAIIGLPMVGKTSLFTILTGVHESTRVGIMEARVGMTKVPDARLDALAKIFEPPKITYATVEYLDFPAISKEALRDPELPGEHARGGRSGACAAAVSERYRAARERLGGSRSAIWRTWTRS